MKRAASLSLSLLEVLKKRFWFETNVKLITGSNRVTATTVKVI